MGISGARETALTSRMLSFRGEAEESRVRDPLLRSGWPRLDESAEPSHAPAELREGRVQLFAPKIGPAYWCRIVLGICRLPQQKVAQAHLATGADDQVKVG